MEIGNHISSPNSGATVTNWDRFWGIFWIDATSDETANGDFSKIAGMNGLEGFEAGKQWIGSRKNNWLLIIDNADNPSNDIFNYFPPGPQGCILITSRNPDTRQYGTNHQGDSGYSELRGMDGEDGVTLLLKSAVPHQVNEEIRALAKPIVVELGGLALAIIQAGATIRQGGAKLEGYVDLYAKHHRELMEKHPGQGLDGYEHTVYTTWEISRKMIESSDSEFRSDAVDFLDISAFLHFDDVPQEILATAPTRSKPTFLDRVFDWGPSPPSKSAPRDSYRIHRALLLLSSFSLISFNEEGDGFSMHRLVHSWTRDRQKVRDRKWCQEAAQIVLADSIHCEREARKTTDYALRKRLAPHVGFLLENTSTCLTEGLLSVKQAQIASKFGLVFLENGKYDKAGTLYRQSVTDMKKALKRDHPDVLNGIHYQALALQSQGNSMGAMTLGKLAVEGREKVLGEDHPDTTESIANLALTLQALGNYDDAEKEGRKALERREKRLGIDDPDTIESVNNLSITLQSQGKLDKAEKMIWRAKEGYEKTLGPSHRDTLMSMSNLAVILRKRGDYPGAEKICLETLRRREEVLGRDHPDTLTSVANLVVILRRQGKLEAAKKLNERALSGYKEILGTHHPNTLASMGNQAQILLRQGKYYDAERMSRQTLAGYEQERGREHIDTILSTSQLASLLYTQKKYPEAFVLFKRACAGYEKRHAKDSAAEKCFQRFILLREEMKRLDIPEPSMMEEQQ
jgi:tetratricopeptide (TPR) repeat protein